MIGGVSRVHGLFVKLLLAIKVVTVTRDFPIETAAVPMLDHKALHLPRLWLLQRFYLVHLVKYNNSKL